MIPNSKFHCIIYSGPIAKQTYKSVQNNKAKTTCVFAFPTDSPTSLLCLYSPVEVKLLESCFATE